MYEACKMACGGEDLVISDVQIKVLTTSATTKEGLAIVKAFYGNPLFSYHH